MPTVTAYLRVSTVDQDLEKNKADILHLANTLELGHVRFVEEKVSGKVSWRNRKIAEIVDQARRGDTIMVSELSRLGRSMLECMEILSIAAQKEINLYGIGKRKLRKWAISYWVLVIRTLSYSLLVVSRHTSERREIRFCVAALLPPSFNPGASQAAQRAVSDEEPAS